MDSQIKFLSCLMELSSGTMTICIEVKNSNKQHKKIGASQIMKPTFDEVFSVLRSVSAQFNSTMTRV